MSEDLETIQNKLSQVFNLPASKEDANEFIMELAAAIDKLLVDDFPRLVNMLYRVDVDEQRLKSELKDNPHANAGLLIAKLIVERQLKKAETKKQFEGNENIPEDEKW